MTKAFDSDPIILVFRLLKSIAYETERIVITCNSPGSINNSTALSAILSLSLHIVSRIKNHGTLLVSTNVLITFPFERFFCTLLSVNEDRYRYRHGTKITKIWSSRLKFIQAIEQFESFRLVCKLFIKVTRFASPRSESQASRTAGSFPKTFTTVVGKSNTCSKNFQRTVSCNHSFLKNENPLSTAFHETEPVGTVGKGVLLRPFTIFELTAYFCENPFFFDTQQQSTRN